VDSHKFTPVVTKQLNYLIKNDFFPFKKKHSYFAITAHVIYKSIDKLNTATHSKKIINLIRNKIGFNNILISDDLSMKSLKDDLKTNVIKTFSAGCNLALHCNGKLSEMKVVGNNSPKVSNFIIKKTKLFYKILS
jgi:beta-N-acetylhexosaminidase